MKVQISMSPELLEMIRCKDEDGNRSKFICKIMQNLFVRDYFSQIEIIDYYPTECPVEVYNDILFEYVHFQHFAYCESFTDALYFQWEFEGKYGAVKREWFDKSIKAAIEKMEKSKSLMRSTYDYEGKMKA